MSEKTKEKGGKSLREMGYLILSVPVSSQDAQCHKEFSTVLSLALLT